MRPGPIKYATRTTTACALALTAASCNLSSHMPWHHPPPPPPVQVHELDISSAGTAAGYPQYWKRNTLLVDLSAASGSGSITLKPAAGTQWPVRVAFRIVPGAIGVLEVSGAQRSTLPITAQGGKPVDLELPPGVYTAATPQMTVSWRALATPASR
jgi:hypothetical protein